MIHQRLSRAASGDHSPTDLKEAHAPSKVVAHAVPKAGLIVASFVDMGRAYVGGSISSQAHAGADPGKAF